MNAAKERSKSKVKSELDAEDDVEKSISKAVFKNNMILNPVEIILNYLYPYHKSLIEITYKDYKNTNSLQKDLISYIIEIENIPTLYISEEGLKKGGVAMYTLPMQSSGDVYHIAAYIILAKNAKCKIPYIFLAYDTDDVKIHAERSLSFAWDIGIGEFFELLEVPHDKGYQPSQRQSTVHDTLKNRGFTYLIDQKLATTMVSKTIIDKGLNVTTNLLKKGFDKYTENLPGDYIKQVEYFINSLLTRIVGKEKPIILMHSRISKSVNTEQNLDKETAQRIINHLNKDDKFYIMHVQMGSFELENVQNIDPFKIPLFNGKDLAKISHMYLLLKLYDMSKNQQIKLVKVLGNTSGTLDLAAFIGLKVLNIHKFKNVEYSYQDFRLMYQSLFMDLIIKGDNLADAVADHIINHNKSQGITIKNANIKGGLGAKGFSQLCSIYDVIQKKWHSTAFAEEVLQEVSKKLLNQNLITQYFPAGKIRNIIDKSNTPLKSERLEREVDDKLIPVLLFNEEDVVEAVPSEDGVLHSSFGIELLRVQQATRSLDGYTFREIPKDGNCMYNAVITALNPSLNNSDNQQLIMELRGRVADNIMNLDNNDENYTSILNHILETVGDIENPIEVYSSNVRNTERLQSTSVWGDEFTLGLIANILNLTIYVHRDSDDFSPVGNGDIEVHLHLRNETHYSVYIGNNWSESFSERLQLLQAPQVATTAIRTINSSDINAFIDDFSIETVKALEQLDNSDIIQASTLELIYMFAVCTLSGFIRPESFDDSNAMNYFHAATCLAKLAYDTYEDSNKELFQPGLEINEQG